MHKDAVGSILKNVASRTKRLWSDAARLGIPLGIIQLLKWQLKIGAFYDRCYQVTTTLVHFEIKLREKN